ncbi:apyrase-like [Pieris brassicae]|uniref:apyrase-like n=1 Tax=Pieris brassicae TaxID=7116 RepID=UPI001E662916|nr:apyrase-like [Pieris brassicae]
MFALKCFMIFISVSYCYGFALPFEGLYELQIIHYNDFHARFEETSVETPTCRFNNASCLGGFPRLFKQIMTLKKEKPDSILLNAGDSYQGTYWYTLLKWKVILEFMNLLPNDAHAIGNHEFDDGPAGLAPYLSGLKAPVVAANMDTSKEPILQGLYKPYIIVERKGRKIGIIGLITTDTKILSSAGEVEFTDPREVTSRLARELSERGVDIIILLSHCGLDVDKEIARNYGQHIDIIVGGHTHSLLWNGPSPSGEVVAGPYPVFIESADQKHKVLIVQASAFTKYMGSLSVFFDYRGEYVKWEGGPIFLNRSMPEDEDIKTRLKPYAEMVHRAEQEVIGETVNTLYADDCIYGECALGDLLVDAMNEYAKVNHKSSNSYISFIQRGNIKSTIPNGQITKGELFELLPFNDRIQTFELQGTYIVKALERSVIDGWSMDPFKGPYILQVSGLTVTYDMKQPEGGRLTSVLVGDAKKPLDPEQVYQVTAPAYLADGGDGFSMFSEGRKNVQVIGRDEKVLEVFIRTHSPLNVTTDGRIVINQFSFR